MLNWDDPLQSTTAPTTTPAKVPPSPVPPPVMAEQRPVEDRRPPHAGDGLVDRFGDRVYARSWQGLWSVLLLKLAHVNLCYAGVASI